MRRMKFRAAPNLAPRVVKKPDVQQSDSASKSSLATEDNSQQELVSEGQSLDSRTAEGKNFRFATLQNPIIDNLKNSNNAIPFIAQTNFHKIKSPVYNSSFDNIFFSHCNVSESKSKPFTPCVKEDTSAESALIDSIPKTLACPTEETSIKAETRNEFPGISSFRKSSVKKVPPKTRRMRFGAAPIINASATKRRSLTISSPEYVGFHSFSKEVSPTHREGSNNHLALYKRNESKSNCVPLLESEVISNVSSNRKSLNPKNSYRLPNSNEERGGGDSEIKYNAGDNFILESSDHRKNKIVSAHDDEDSSTRASTAAEGFVSLKKRPNVSADDNLHCSNEDINSDSLVESKGNTYFNEKHFSGGTRRDNVEKELTESSVTHTDVFTNKLQGHESCTLNLVENDDTNCLKVKRKYSDSAGRRARIKALPSIRNSKRKNVGPTMVSNICDKKNSSSDLLIKDPHKYPTSTRHSFMVEDSTNIGKERDLFITSESNSLTHSTSIDDLTELDQACFAKQELLDPGTRNNSFDSNAPNAVELRHDGLLLNRFHPKEPLATSDFSSDTALQDSKSLTEPRNNCAFDSADAIGSSESLQYLENTPWAIETFSSTKSTKPEKKLSENLKLKRSETNICFAGETVSLSETTSGPVQDKNGDLGTRCQQFTHECDEFKDLNKERKFIHYPPKSRLKMPDSREKLIYKERKMNFKRKVLQGTLHKDGMTMFDLIFYNPSSNPMPGRKERKCPRKRSDSTNSTTAGGTANEELLTEEAGLEIGEDRLNHTTPEISCCTKLGLGEVQGGIGGLNVSGNVQNKKDLAETIKKRSTILAPQLKIGPNGELVVDEKSLQIQTTASKNRDEILNYSEAVEEDDNESCHYGKFSKRRKRANEWTMNETSRFYKALSTVGTDFSLMATLFTWRTRAELKTKFKKEERANKHLIDVALNDCTQFDFTIFEESEFDPEKDRQESKKMEKHQEKLRRDLERKQRYQLRKEERVKNHLQKVADRERKRMLRNVRDQYRKKKKQMSEPVRVHKGTTNNHVLYPESTQTDSEEFICEVLEGDQLARIEGYEGNEFLENTRKTICVDDISNQDYMTTDLEDGKCVATPIQFQLPVSAVQNDNGMYFAKLQFGEEIKHIPLPPLTPHTESIVILVSPPADGRGENVYHVYFLGPIIPSPENSTDQSDGNTCGSVDTNSSDYPTDGKEQLCSENLSTDAADGDALATDGELLYGIRDYHDFGSA